MKVRMLCFLFMIGSWIFAQNDMIANVNLQFQFANPGARSLGMGGAFVGLADDQTALFANPAGLTNLRQRTVSVEAQLMRNDVLIPFHGGEILQTGTHDLVFNLESREFPEEHISVPFLSFVIPMEKVNMGFFYARQADTRRSFSTDSVVIPAVPFQIRPVIRFETHYFFPTENRLTMDLESIGASVGWRFNDAFSIGATLAISRLTYVAQTKLNLPAFQEEGLQFLEPLFGENLAIIDAEGDESAASGFFGMLYRPNDRFQVGMTYQHYPEFDYDYEVNQRQIDFQTLEMMPYEIEEEGSAGFQVPDNASVGVSMQSSEAFLMTAEIKRVFYSELTDQSQHFFEQNGNDQRTEDVTEYHFGMEYFFLNAAIPFSIRGGYWFDPYHAMKNTLADTQILYRTETGEQGVRNAVFLQQFERDLDHLSFGFGVSPIGNLQVDFAVDISEETRLLSLSGTWRY